MSFNNRDNRGGRKDFGRGGGRGFGGNRGDRQMFQAVCSNCGRECEVPFQPTGSKPVLCSDCFRNANGGSSGRSDRPQRRNFDDRRSSAPRSDDRLEALNAKLDKIISILESRNEKIETDTSVIIPEVENVELQPEATIVIEKKKKSKKTDSGSLE